MVSIEGHKGSHQPMPAQPTALCGSAPCTAPGGGLAARDRSTSIKPPVQLRGKAMADKAGDMLDIARDILLTARLDDRERFKQVGWRGVRGRCRRAGMSTPNCLRQDFEGR